MLDFKSLTTQTIVERRRSIIMDIDYDEVDDPLVQEDEKNRVNFREQYIIRELI